MTRLLLPLCLSALLLTACSGAVEDPLPGQPIKHRQEAFKEMLRAFEPMGTMLRADAYDPDRFAAMSATLDGLKDKPWGYFVADSQVPPTKARAEVWSRADEFERSRVAFIDAVDKLNQAAIARDKTVIGPIYDAVYKTCQDCHRSFRVK